MKPIFLLFSILFSFVVCFAQSLNGYKYVVVHIPTYQNGGIDNFGIGNDLQQDFAGEGFIILRDDGKEWPFEAQGNYCLILDCWPLNSGVSTVEVIAKNCRSEVIFDEKSTAVNWSNDHTDNFTRALKNCWGRISKRLSFFDSAYTPHLDYSNVETTDETESTIKNYLLSNAIDPIEGIYKSTETDILPYTIGIVKKGDTYKAIVIQSDRVQWKIGEVKAIFQLTSMRGFFSTKWYTGNKQLIETFSSLDNDALLTIELKDAKGNKILDRYIKMFPAFNQRNPQKSDGASVSGSGFFVSTNGIIATNAHVVASAKKIEVTVSNELGLYTYNAKVKLTDKINDVAILQIDDDKFKGLNSLPYGIVESGEVGSKVFTIGYPLNDVMGSNYKVADGIISSKTGIADDIRYYQISVPLQPGNSGGPLFDKNGNVIGLTSARLNGDAIGTQVENVSYAIKSAYLLNLYNMLPDAQKITTISQVASKEFQEQIKILKNYVCLIKVY